MPAAQLAVQPGRDWCARSHLVGELAALAEIRGDPGVDEAGVEAVAADPDTRSCQDCVGRARIDPRTDPDQGEVTGTPAEVGNQNELVVIEPVDAGSLLSAARRIAGQAGQAGVDLIAEQIRIAAGEKLSLRQEEIALRGHAIEFRINAEDASDNFRPQTGEIERLILPGGPGVRIDTHLYPGYEVPPFYDSLLAKLIVWGEDREMALARSARALAEFEIEGVTTNIPFHRGIIENDAFREARVSTNLLDRVGPGAFVAG